MPSPENANRPKAAACDVLSVRHLRVTIVANGHVCGEPILRDRGEVTVGTEPQCTFHVPADAALSRTVLFAHRGESWSLSLTPSVEGFVGRDGTITPLSDLRARGACDLILDESTYGQVTIAGLTLSFQLVASPTVRDAVRTTLVRRPLCDRDWVYNACVAGSCALAFAGLAYVEFGYDPVVVEPLTPISMDVRHLLLDGRPTIPEPPAPDDHPGPAKTEDPTSTHNSLQPRTLADWFEDHLHLLDVRRRSLSIFAECYGPALHPRDISPDEFAALTGPLDRTGPEFTTLIGPVHSLTRRPGRMDGRPTIHISVTRSEPTSASPTMRQIGAVFRRNVGAMQSCYRAGLRDNPSLHGRMSIRFVIGTSGHVVNAPEVSGLSDGDGVHRCIARRVRNLVFPVLPEGVTVTFFVDVAPGR